MSEELYQIFSLGMRYWFTLLGVLIVIRTFLWLHHDRAAKHRRLRSMPDAGLVGELVVLQGTDDFPAGTAIPLPYEGTLGFLRGCDVVIPCEGVSRQHLDFSFQPHLGLLVYPRRNLSCMVDGEEQTSKSRAKDRPLHHGSILQIGEIQLRVRLFAGLDGGGRSHFADETPIAVIPNEQFARTGDIPVQQVPQGWVAMMPQQTQAWPFYCPPTEQLQNPPSEQAGAPVYTQPQPYSQPVPQPFQTYQPPIQYPAGQQPVQGNPYGKTAYPPQSTAPYQQPAPWYPPQQPSPYVPQQATYAQPVQPTQNSTAQPEAFSQGRARRRLRRRHDEDEEA